jgi:hypothetical protein
VICGLADVAAILGEYVGRPPWNNFKAKTPLSLFFKCIGVEICMYLYLGGEKGAQAPLTVIEFTFCFRAKGEILIYLNKYICFAVLLALKPFCTCLLPPLVGGDYRGLTAYKYKQKSCPQSSCQCYLVLALNFYAHTGAQ